MVAARTLRVPGDLLDQPVYSHCRLAQGCVVSYASQRGMTAQRVLVTELLVVHVRRGLKRLHSCHDLDARDVPAGQLVVIPPGLCFMSELVEGKGVSFTDYSSTVIALSGDFLADSSLEPQHQPRQAGGAPEGPPDGLPVGPWAPLVVEPQPYLDSVLRTLPTKLASAPDDRLLELQLRELLITLEHSSAAPLLARVAREVRSDADARLRSVVTRHRGAPIQLDEMATLCGRSLSSFKRDFQRLFGTSPGRWQQDMRLEHAAALLRRRAHNVTQVASMAGFGDPSSFIRAFRAKYGITPKQLQLHGA
ncbi:MAG: AraC family transcriptional regulator [Myxococcota bacterium]